MKDLINRLRGIYPIGPDGVYGKRDFSDFIPPISLEAADALENSIPISKIEELINSPVLFGIKRRHPSEQTTHLDTYWINQEQLQKLIDEAND